MSDFLKKIAGTKLKLILEKTTNNVFKGLLVGFVLTALIQSSSATIAIVIGLVSANLLNLKNAVGIIFGAKIGTTVTAVVISFNLGSYALLIVFIAIIMLLFVKHRLLKNIGGALLGFGLLFLGLNLMSSALSELVASPAFATFLTSASKYPVVGLLIGILATAIIQSSSAVIGIVQEVFKTGSVPLIIAIALVIGSNIGTTITSVFASLKASREGKKVALLHVIISVISSLGFFVFLRPYTALITWMATLFGFSATTSMATIALAHIVLNVITLLLLFWFTNQLVWLANKLIKEKAGVIKQNIVLEKQLIVAAPELALQSTDEAIFEMGTIVSQMYEFSEKYAFEKDEDACELALACEQKINQLDIDIHNYLARLGAENLDERQMQKVIKNIDTVTDLERIGDHLENVIEFFTVRHEHKIVASSEVEAELTTFFNVIKSQLMKAVRAYYEMDKEVATEVITKENEVNALFKTYRNNNTMRISQDLAINNYNHYVDILSNLERIGDHAYNIAESVTSKQYVHTEKTIKA